MSTANAISPSPGLFHFVTAGLEPVVHADMPPDKAMKKGRRAGRMDCRVKPGNDEQKIRVLAARLFARASLFDPVPPKNATKATKEKQKKDAERRQMQTV